MRRKARSILAASALLLGTLAAAPFAQAEPQAGNQAGAGKAADPATEAVKVFEADVAEEQIPLLLALGQDAHELGERAPERGTARVELFLTDAQAAGLEKQGVQVTERKVPAKAQARLRAAGDGVYRPYSGKGNLGEEIVETAAAHPDIAKAVSIGKTRQGQDILALKLSKHARKTKDGSKPAVLYMSNQHAREWITPEMTRRLMHHYIDNYGKDRRITRVVDSAELWFVISANPDGYDHTHKSPANRLWRKNLRDNDADGAITNADGVDLNRNFPYKWGYDNEGSSPNPASQTYRGTGPASEPETVAVDRFMKRIGFTYGINYHSAAELILYGVGWQVATPTPDDVLYKALAGTPENPAVPGYYPQLSSELYTTNGETDGHAANVNGTMMFTPEMTTCQTASDIDPDDPWKREDCQSGFNFPDDEKLIQAEFAKNVPFALSVAETALHPDRPSSVVGLDAPDFTVDPFDVSYARGGSQEVSVVARKSVRHKELNYRINGGRVHDQKLRPWRGGERYGGEDNISFDEYRARVRGAGVGDRVEVWFTGRTGYGQRTSSEHFTYTVAERPRARTLVIAEEGASARHTRTYVDALRAAGRKAAVWDVATQGAPHPLGVLSHFSAAVHYTGDRAPGGETQLALRDYLNEGGRLIEAGEAAGGSAQVGRAVTNDFSQYYLGAYSRASAQTATGLIGAGRLDGFTGPLAGAAGNPLEAAGAYTVTSDSLPAEDFPQFTAAQAGSYSGVRNPYAPYAGDWMASAPHADNDWKRLARTVDLTGVTAADKPRLELALNWNHEPGYDHALLEAHTVGADDWTTLPEASGLTGTAVPTECDAGFFVNGHPFLRHYLTLDSGGCTATGSTGEWHSFTASSGGWRQVSFDLSRYAGRQIELSLSSVTDPGTGGRGVFADEARLVVGGAQQQAEGFESSLGPWAVRTAPEGSPEVAGDWGRTGELFTSYAAVTTRDTVLLGFGLEHIPSAADRARLVLKALRALHR
ncbi:M14 family metallopeptidase [Streptomyces sp. MUM 178J]|uniref:M14 family metallopeptidase n=1 Tax=Streptomyces sp. MUM 178J TaxID=2791991 RepID=UPI001F0352AD|nr:M14 family metallopeptidase [Streptomyces sp. MUM 178J]WRQ78860.1 M14 family zinc carboxypeptidase [Streptomyces sp. MUM 178J]